MDKMWSFVRQVALMYQAWFSADFELEDRYRMGLYDMLNEYYPDTVKEIMEAQKPRAVSVKEHVVVGDKEDYVVKEFPDGSWTCNCPAFGYRSHMNWCHHIGVAKIRKVDRALPVVFHNGPALRKWKMGGVLSLYLPLMPMEYSMSVRTAANLFHMIENGWSIAQIKQRFHYDITSGKLFNRIMRLSSNTQFIEDHHL